MPEEIKAVCKHCGKSGPVSGFVLDPDFKMMICSNCAKEKKVVKKTPAKNSVIKPVQSKPAGWDNEDDYLERARKEKMRQAAAMPQYKPIDGVKVRVTCSKCKFKFNYNKEKRYPNICPNCGTKIDLR